MADALDVLLTFSSERGDTLALERTNHLLQASIGYELAHRGVLLWKAYASSGKLEVLPRSLPRLSEAAYQEFKALWHSVPGLRGQLRHRGVVPTIALKAILLPTIWMPFQACLEWGLDVQGEIASTAQAVDLALDTVVDRLATARRRATYGAVGTYLGRPATFLMQGRPRDHRNSWVVNAESGRPTGYAETECDPNLTSDPHIMRTADELVGWMSTPWRPS